MLYNVFCWQGFGTEKFYVDFHEENVCFQAKSVEEAIKLGQDFFRNHSMYGHFTTEKWIRSQEWGAEEVQTK